MSGLALTHLREALAGLLEDPSITVHTYVPETLEAPCIVLQEGEPFIAPVEQFSEEWAVHFDLFLVTDHYSNEAATTAGDELVTHVLGALAGSDFGIDQIGRPGPIHTSEWLARALTVSVSALITLT